MKNKHKFNVLPPTGFKAPSELPKNDYESLLWQSANKSWWESTPMKYDWNSAVKQDEGTAEYYDEIDKRLFEVHELFVPRIKRPYDRIIPYDFIAKSNVLEIGVGNGTHAELFSRNSKSFTGIDLTNFASISTKKRFSLKKLSGKIYQMDAEELTFPDNEFDFVWSWGVIHHSSNTSKVLDQIRRVLKPKGEVIVMVYHKSFWYYYFINGFVRGIILGKLFKLGSIHNVVQFYTDGAIARYYSVNEWTTLIKNRFKIIKTSVYGQKLEAIPLPYSKLKLLISKIFPSSLTRLFLNNLRQGSMLVVHMKPIK
jgi:ubiquinone/menaquinone biosynthesis C-methylase UbiE